MAQTLRHLTAPVPISAGEENSLAPRPKRMALIAENTQLVPDTAASTVARGAGAVGLAAIALIHVLDAPGTYDGTRYIFWLYLALIAGCLGGAALLLRGHSRLGWLAAATLSLSPFIGFVLSRSTGLPGDTGDIGNWTEPLGMASLFVEACVCALSFYGLSLLRRSAAPMPEAVSHHRTR